MIAVTDNAQLHLSTPLSHKVFALHNPGNKNILYKSHGLWSAVNPELRSVCSGYNSTIRRWCGCKCVLCPLLREQVCVWCRKLTNFIESISEIFQVIPGNLRDVILHPGSWFVYLKDEHMLTPYCKEVRGKVLLTASGSAATASDVSVPLRRGCHCNGISPACCLVTSGMSSHALSHNTCIYTLLSWPKRDKSSTFVCPRAPR